MALRHLGWFGLGGALFCCSAPTVGIDPPPALVPLAPRVTGANLRSTSDPRSGYGSLAAHHALRRLQGLGVNTIAILYEARLSGVAATEVRPAGLDDQRAIVAALLEANRMGFATVLVPYLILDDGRWRGEIELDDRSRPAFWASYRSWIMTAAELARRGGATVLSLGVELKSLSGEPQSVAEMRALAGSVRAVFGGQLTYHANWDEAEAVRFWDAVDLVGVNAYYPLLPDPIRGAEAVARRLTRLALYTEREVLVLEVGYCSSPLSHVRPWEWPTELDPIVDEAAQANAWAAVLGEWLTAPQVRGLMIWVIATDPDDPSSEPRHGFSPLGKAAEAVIGRGFGGPDEG